MKPVRWLRSSNLPPLVIIDNLLSKTLYNKYFIACSIAFYGFYLRFMHRVQKKFWVDEKLQFANIRGELKPFWTRVHFISGDHTAFPGEYLLNFPLVHLVGRNKWGLVIPHICSTIIGFFLLFKICKRLFKTNMGYFVAFLIVALNKNLIQHSFEFRPYAILPTLALANFYFMDLLISDFQGVSRRKRWFLSVLFISCFFYHAYGILLFGLPLLFTILRREIRFRDIWKRADFKYFLIIFCVGFPIWAWYAAGNNFGITPYVQQRTGDIFQYIPNPLTDPIGFSKGIVGNLMGNRILYLLLPGIILSLLIPSGERKHQLMFLFILVILPITLIMLVDIKTNYWFLQRQFVWVMPLFAIYMGWCWDSIFLWLKRVIPNANAAISTKPC